MVAAVSVGVVSASVQLYRVSSGTVAASATEPWFFFEVAASRNGEQFAVPTYVGTYIFDQNLNQIGNLIGEGAGGSPIGAVYSSTFDLVYFSWCGSATATRGSTCITRIP